MSVSVEDPQQDRRGGLLVILAATAFAGATGYLLQVLVPAWLGNAEAYLQFTVFWSTTFLVVSIISGLQQEIARATSRAPGNKPGPALTREASASARTIWKLAMTVAGVGSVVIAIFILVGGRSLFSGNGVPELIALVIAAVGYTMVAVLSGLFYGVEDYSAAASVTAVDGALRFVMVSFPLLLGFNYIFGMYGVAIPFALTVILMWLMVRGRIRGRFRLDTTFRVMLSNSLQAMIAAFATGILISGLPTVLKLAAGELSSETLAAIVLALTITRAPLVIPILALQSYLVVTYRAQAHRALRRALVLFSGCLIVTALFAWMAWAFGSEAIEKIYGPSMSLEGAHMGLIMLSGGLTAGLCVVAPALLAHGRHRNYVASWMIAALCTVGGLVAAGSTVTGVLVAILVGPLVACIAALWMLSSKRAQHEAGLA